MKRYEYYDMNDKPIKGPNATLRGAKMFEAGKSRIVKQTMTRLGYWVSTVWLGLNHNWMAGPPDIYETMVFHGMASDLEMERYATRKEAEAGHERMVKKWSNPFYVAFKFIDDKTWRLRYRIREFFATRKEADARISELLLDQDVKKGSIYLFEVGERYKVELKTQYELKKL